MLRITLLSVTALGLITACTHLDDDGVNSAIENQLACQPITGPTAAALEGHWEGIGNESRTLYVFSLSEFGAYRLFAIDDNGTRLQTLSQGSYGFHGEHLTFFDDVHQRTERISVNAHTLVFHIDDDSRSPQTYRRVTCPP